MDFWGIVGRDGVWVDAGGGFESACGMAGGISAGGGGGGWSGVLSGVAASGFFGGAKRLVRGAAGLRRAVVAGVWSSRRRCRGVQRCVYVYLF